MSNLRQHQPAHGTSGCPSAGELLDFASGEASDEALFLIADHVATCESCERALRTIGSTGDPLSTRVRRALQSEVEGDESECFRMMQAALELGSVEHAPADQEMDQTCFVPPDARPYARRAEEMQ